MRKVNACNLNGAKKQQHLGVEFCSREKEKKSCSCLWNKPPQGISVETKLSLNNNKIKIWWWWLDAKSCNTPAIGSASQALAPRSKLRDLEASDLESRKTMPRLLAYCATLKGWTFRLSANFHEHTKLLIWKRKPYLLPWLVLFYSGTKETSNHPYSSKYHIYLLFTHIYCHVSSESWWPGMLEPQDLHAKISF